MLIQAMLSIPWAGAPRVPNRSTTFTFWTGHAASDSPHEIKVLSRGRVDTLSNRRVNEPKGTRNVGGHKRLSYKAVHTVRAMMMEEWNQLAPLMAIR